MSALDDHLDQFHHRVLTDAMSEATSRYWQRRAAMYEWARPRPGDHIGTAGRRRVDELDAALVVARDDALLRARLAPIGVAA